VCAAPERPGQRGGGQQGSRGERGAPRPRPGGDDHEACDDRHGKDDQLALVLRVGGCREEERPEERVAGRPAVDPQTHRDHARAGERRHGHVGVADRQELDRGAHHGQREEWREQDEAGTAAAAQQVADRPDGGAEQDPQLGVELLCVWPAHRAPEQRLEEGLEDRVVRVRGPRLLVLHDVGTEAASEVEEGERLVGPDGRVVADGRRPPDAVRADEHQQRHRRDPDAPRPRLEAAGRWRRLRLVVRAAAAHEPARGSEQTGQQERDREELREAHGEPERHQRDQQRHRGGDSREVGRADRRRDVTDAPHEPERVEEGGARQQEQAVHGHEGGVGAAHGSVTSTRSRS
jgi:hypothetical protein